MGWISALLNPQDKIMLVLFGIILIVLAVPVVFAWTGGWIPILGTLATAILITIGAIVIGVLVGIIVIIGVMMKK